MPTTANSPAPDKPTACCHLIAVRALETASVKQIKTLQERLRIGIPIVTRNVVKPNFYEITSAKWKVKIAYRN